MDADKVLHGLLPGDSHSCSRAQEKHTGRWDGLWEWWGSVRDAELDQVCISMVSSLVYVQNGDAIAQVNSKEQVSPVILSCLFYNSWFVVSDWHFYRCLPWVYKPKVLFIEWELHVWEEGLIHDGPGRSEFNHMQWTIFLSIRSIFV